jgi:Predicted periplasmic lipoprotein (DUF2279)
LKYHRLHHLIEVSKYSYTFVKIIILPLSKKYFAPFLILLFGFWHNLSSQSLLMPADTLHPTRAKVALYGTLGIYTTFSVGLYNVWYKKYAQESFHFFNDAGEWSNMDKYGHIYMAYLQGKICYKIAKWTGLKEKKSIMAGILAGTLFQSTLEVMDGFSSKWGFSIPDMGANLAGTTLFASQQYLWSEQRIALKMNSLPIIYSNYPIFDTNNTTATSLLQRANALYGRSYLERFLKDYNGQVYWLSTNINSFYNHKILWPKWLNVAVGYGAQNMFGGYSNQWEEDVNIYILDDKKFPRIHQFYLGLDVDLSRIKTKSPFVRSVLSVFDVFKIPSPAIELNSLGQFTFHILR